MDLSLFWLLLFGTTALTTTSARSSSKSNNARDYFRACLGLKESWQSFNGQNQAQQLNHPLHHQDLELAKKPPPCRSYVCLSRSDDLELRRLGLFLCNSHLDCASDVSAMVCRNFSGFRQKYCDCPDGYAYNTNECRCKPAELCWVDSEPCHKGMKCEDNRCSCADLENSRLFEPQGGFCVLPRTTHHGLNYIVATDDTLEGKKDPAIIVVGLLAAFLIIGLISIVLYVVTARSKDLDICARGDYVCDHDDIKPGNRRNQPHVAAWDAPGMDFLSEEQTLKYENRSGMTKTPSVATTAELVDEAPSPSGSLPECEQQSSRRANESNYDNPVFNQDQNVESEDENEERIRQTTKSSNML